MRATPDGDGQADLRRAPRARSRTAISRGVPDDPPQPADVEEGLVDREALDQRRGVVEHLEHGLAGLGVGREAGRHHDGVRAQRAGLAAAHGGAHAAGLGLVAGGQHDAAADDHRPARAGAGSSRCSTDA